MTNPQIETEGLLAGLLGRVHVIPDDEEPTCPYLAHDEDRCLGDMHEIRGSRDVRRCAGDRIRTAARPIVGMLARYGADPEQTLAGVDPVPALLESLRPMPATTGFDRVHRMLREVTAHHAEARLYHVVIHGHVGTAKSHALLVLYFNAVRQGCKCVWTSWTDWREQAQRAESFDEAVASAALTWFNSVERADVVVIDDVLAVGWAFQAERSRVQSRLAQYLERRRGRALVSTNLSPAELRDEANLGERLWSRLSETRVVTNSLGQTLREPVRLLELRGTDQRGAQ